MISANEIFLKLVGYSLDEVRGKNYAMFVDSAVRGTASYQDFWPALSRGESRQGEYRKVSRDGRDVWVQGVYNPILDAQGKPAKIVAYLSDITTQRQEAMLNAAFRGALNQLDANVMVADNDLKIIFVNPAAAQMLGRAQEAFRRDLPAFDASALQGASLESMTRDPATLRGEIERLTNLATRQEVIGGRSMKTIMSPMKDESGRRLGTVLEWFDRTQEVATESELQGVIGAVTAGNLANRISLDGKRDFFLTLSRGINELVDAIGGVVEEVQGLVAAANQGDLTRRIVTEGKAGLMVKIGGGINDLTDNLSGLVSQVKAASLAVSRGADEISQGNANLSQRTEEQASSLEETASSMEEMTSTVKQNADNAAQANQLAVAARDQAEKGGAVVAKAVQGHDRHQRCLEEDRRHHRRDRRNRLPDQPAGAERRGRSRARRRAGPWLRGGGIGSAQPRGPLGHRGQGDQGTDPGQRAQGRRGLEPGHAVRRDARSDRQRRQEGHGHRGGDCRCVERAVRRHRAGEQGSDAARRDDAAERGAGRGSLGRQPVDGGPGSRPE